MELYQKYRPKTLAEFIGQDKVKTQIQRVISRSDWDRDALWIQGPSGAGKTSLAWIIAAQVSSEFYTLELVVD